MAAGIIVLGVVFMILIDIVRNNVAERMKIYGNDKESIVKYIHSFEEYENLTIEILEMRDIEDLRFVGFLAGGHPGGVLFQKDEAGNFLGERLEVNKSRSMHFFFYPIPPVHPWFMFVTNRRNEVAKFQVTVNGEIVEQELTPNKNSVVFTKIKKSQKDRYGFHDYRYYDAYGNPIEP